MGTVYRRAPGEPAPRRRYTGATARRPAITPIDATPGDDVREEAVVPIVVGAHLRAEVGDRPSAAWLRDMLGGPLSAGGLVPVVVTDLWYLNADGLRRRPTVSVGAPEVNALTAHLAARVPSAFVADGVLMVQLDVELNDPTVCCWGVDARATAAAVRVFADRYLDRWARAVLGGHGA